MTVPRNTRVLWKRQIQRFEIIAATALAREISLMISIVNRSYI
jgi:hypothetical protein